MPSRAEILRKLIGGRPTAAGLFHTAATLCLLVSLAGLLDACGWPWELPAHFRIQCACFLAVCCAVQLLLRAWARLAVFGLSTAVLWGTLLPAGPPPRAPQTLSDPPLRLCSFNVHTANRDFQPTLDFLRTNRFDAVFLMEIDRLWLDALQPLRAEYPFLVADPREDNFGVAFLARAKPARAEIVWLGLAEVPSVVAKVGGLSMICTHPLPPAYREGAALRDDQLSAVAERARQENAAIVLGDLNCTPWTAPFKNFEKGSGLRGPSVRGGWRATWPAMNPAWLRIPIDHALAGPGAVLLDVRPGPDLGSDHLPLIVEVAARNR